MPAEKFEKMLSEARDNKFSIDSLNKYMRSELALHEKQHVKLTHKRSTILHDRKRENAMFVNAYAFCSYKKNCPVTYHIRVKDRSIENGHIRVNVKIANQHDHVSPPGTTKQVRGADRTELAQQIIVNNGGSSIDARYRHLTEKAQNNDETKEVPSLNVYNKCKAEFKHKDVPTSDWIVNLLYVGRSTEILT